MTTTRTYRSTDASAPVLTGVAGSLLTVLDAVLVNGYGSQTAAGWTKPFVNSGNKGCYRNSAVDGTGYYLNIDDNGTTTAKEAYCTGFATMSALSTGTGQFPTSSQLALGTTPVGAVVARKSNTADSTARVWTITADDTVFYLFMENGDQTTPFGTSVLFFGDFFSYAASDPGRCMLIGRNAANASGFSPEWSACLNGAVAGIGGNLSYTLPGHFIAQSFTGIGGSILFGKHSDTYKSNCSGFISFSGVTGTSGQSTGSAVGYGSGLSTMSYPNPTDGGLYLAPIWIHHNNALRGYFKGLWAPVQVNPLNHADTFSGSGAFSGKTFLVQNVMWGINGITNYGQYFVETSSTWS